MYIIVAMMLLAQDQETSHQIDQKAAIQLAETARAYLVNNVKDYTGILVKREYVDGKDSGHQYLRFKFREEPLGIYIKYLKPPSVQDREVLYNGGEEMLVKRGGRRNSSMTLTITIDSPVATDGNKYGIQEMGLRKLSEKLLIQLKTEMSIPDTEVVVYHNAKLDGRVVTHYRLIHHTRTPETISKMAEISIDKELQIPIYYRALGWDQPTVVLEEYAFRDVVLNVGLTDADFSATNPEYGFQQHEQ